VGTSSSSIWNRPSQRAFDVASGFTRACAAPKDGATCAEVLRRESPTSDAGLRMQHLYKKSGKRQIYSSRVRIMEESGLGSRIMACRRRSILLPIFMTLVVVATLQVATSWLPRVRPKVKADGVRAVSHAVRRQVALTGTGTGQFMALSADKTYLVNTITGRPVFITGEAPWSLIAQPSNADVETYLADRASRGYNAVIVNLIEHLYADNCSSCPDGCPDYNGACPFTGADFSTPNEAYFAHADYVIQRASTYGIAIFLFNSYLGYSSRACNKFNEGWAMAMESASDATMTAWGVYVGNRYKSFPNVIHVVGDDADPSTCSPSLVGKLNDIATGIASVDPVHLQSAANAGDLASQDVFTPLSSYPWLQISDMYQGTVSQWNRQYTRSDFLPSFSGEYDAENNPNGDTPYQLRVAHYQGELSGLYLGAFFQNRPIWCFNTASGVAGQSSSQWGRGFCSVATWGAWQNYLSSQGSTDQARLGQLFRSREHWKLVPDINHRVVTTGYGSSSSCTNSFPPCSSLTATARTSDGQTIIAYIPNGNAAAPTVDMTRVTSARHQARCWWFNPSSGVSTLIGSYANSGTQNFRPPDSSDWVLVIDDAGANLPAPGSADL